MSQNLKHKILTQEETPKYSFRKYSFGLASALIGLTAFSGGVKGTIAKADTVSNSAVADQKDTDAKQNNKQATLGISYSDDQKQTQDSNKSVAENNNDNQVNTDQKQAANVQAKNDSQVSSHNESNESKEPAVTVNKQATAQQTNSNTVKEEQESKQVVTKSQENNNTSTATKQVKNNEISATIANAMVNNGETRSAVAPKADENKNTTTLDVNKLPAESNNTKGNFLSLLNNFAVVNSASTKAPYDIDANWDYTITKSTSSTIEKATDHNLTWVSQTPVYNVQSVTETGGDGEKHAGKLGYVKITWSWSDSKNNKHCMYSEEPVFRTDVGGGLKNGDIISDLNDYNELTNVGNYYGSIQDNILYTDNTTHGTDWVRLDGTPTNSGDTTATVESYTVNIANYKGTSNDVFIPNAADFKADGKNNVDAVHINPSLMRKLATRQGTTSITVSNTDGQFVDAVDDSNFTMDNSGNLPVYSVDSNGNPTNVNWNNTDLATGGNKTTGTDLFGHHDGWKYVFQNGHQGWYYVNNGVIYSDDKLPSKTESVVTGTKKQLIPISTNWGFCGATLSNIKQNGNVYTANVNTLSLTMGHTSFDKNNPYVMHNFGTITLTMYGNSALPESDVETIIKDLMEGKVGRWDYDNYNSWYYDVDDTGDPSTGSSIMQGYGVSKAILEGSPYPTGGSTVTVPTKSNTQFIDYNDVNNITRSPANVASTLKSVDTNGLHGADIDPFTNNTIAREYKIIENLPDGTQKVLFDWNGQINQNPDGTYNQYPTQVTVTGASGQYTQPKNATNGNIDNGWWHITPDIKSDYTISVTPEYSTDDATKMGLELMPQYDSNNNLTHITFDLAPSKSMLQSQTFYVNYTAQTKQMKVGEDGITDHDLHRTITRTITITDPQGKTTNQTQTVSFNRTGTINTATGEKHFNAWQNDKDGKDTYTFDSVAVPAVNGYTASGSIPSEAVTPDSSDSSVSINYVANGQTSSYYFVDDDGNGQKVGEDHQISGKTDQTINFTVAAPANYELVNAQDANQSYTFKADGNTPVVIHLKHHRASATGAKNKDVDDHRTIIREIDIVSPDGKQTVERQTVEFTRPATEDMVTGQITYGDWSDGGQKQMPALTLPDKSGYHADITVPALTVTPDSKPEPVKVTYVASDQAVKLSFVDRSGAVVGTKTINGKTDQTYNVSLSDLPAHYEIDGSLPVYKFTDQADQALTVHVKQNKDDYTAIAQQITVKHGETPNASDGIKNTQDMPSGTSYAWGTEPQLPQGKTYGDTTGTVVVTFPDGSNENVTVPVRFNSEAEDNAKKGDQAVAFNGTKTYYHGQAVADLTLNDLTNADNVKSVVWANKPDTSKIGSGADSATVTFNDGTTTVINGNYTVTPNDSDKTGTIETQPITVKHGQDPASVDPKDGIKTTLPDGTKVNWTTKPALPSGQTYGDTKGTAEVDFPDGSKQSVEIPVHVNSDAEDNAKKGDQAVAFNGTKTYYHGQAVADLTLNDLTNADNVKSVVWANKPDTSKIGAGADSATVTFNDGTTTVINGNYTVTPNDSDKTGTIETQPITVKHGQDPASVDPKDGIKTTLPDGTKVNWTTKPALPSGQTYGDTKGTAEVDFPDGSKQSVEIPVHVNSDAEDNKSKGDQGVSLKVTDKVYYHGENVPDLTLNDLINADNVKSVVWANKPDTSKIGAGSDSATVTFNDGTTATVGGSYVVNPNDSDKTGTIETQPITVKHGQDPASIDPKEGIKTKLPDGTKVDWTTKPELPSGQTYGDTKGTAEVTFPDGSKQSVEIPVHFNSQAEDNAKKGDQGVGFKNPSQVYSHNQTVPDLTLNDLNNPDNVKSVVWANKPDTSKTGAGTDSATVTFNDGSTVTIKGSYVVNSIDATDLSKAIKDGQDAQKTTKYTNGSDKAKKDLDDALNKGIKDINNPDLSQDQADKDAKDIEDAIKNLDGKATDTTNLDKAIKDGKDAQKTVHYDNSSDKAKKDLDDAINKAVKDKKNPNLSQDQADKDAKDIEDAIKNLDGKATDTSNLNKAIKDGQNAQKSDKYKNSTSKAQKTLDDAINKAINDLKNPNLTQKQADQDARAIEDAIKGLDGKANNNKQSQGTKTNTKTDGNGVVQASTIGDKTNSNELPQTGENNNTIALASGIATALTAGIGMLAEGKKRKRE